MRPFIPRLLLSAALLAGCGELEPERAAAEPAVYTTFYPTAYFTARIAGGTPRVVCPVPDGEDPIFWEPARELVAEYQAADLVVLNGAGFERWVEHASLPASRIVDSAAPFRERFLRFDALTHSHGAGGEHTHAGIDGHTWLDPVNARLQAAEIARALSARWPERASVFAANLAALDLELAELDARLRELGPPRLAEVALLAAHPAYDYLAARYGFEITKLDLDPAAPLGEEQLEAVRAALIELRPRLLLWEREPRTESARLLRERFELASVVFSPCELLPPEERAAGRDYLDLMHANLERLARALAGD